MKIKAEVQKIIDRRVVNKAKDDLIHLRKIKILAAILKYKFDWPNTDILDSLPINRNQFKNACAVYKDHDLMTIEFEKRGFHKKKDSLRSEENIAYIRKIITESKNNITVKEVRERFQNEKLGRKC